MFRATLSTCLLIPAVLLSAVVAALGADPPALRAPVPSAAAQDTAAELIREVFKADLAAAKTPTQKATLAGKLVQSAGDTKDDLAGKYVQLREARDLAIEAGEIAVAMKVIDQTATDFAIDALAGALIEQDGSDGANVSFPLDQAEAVFEIMGPCRKRQVSDQERERLRGLGLRHGFQKPTAERQSVDAA